MALETGMTIPDFTLPDQEGNLFSPSQLIGKKPMVLFFYPKDFTPGCTREVCAFRDSYEEFRELGAEVVGISSDSQSSHEKFAGKHQLPFRLLSDSDKKVRGLFGVKGKIFNLLPGRETYVTDRQGVIRFIFNSMDPVGHMKQSLQALKAQKLK